MQLSPNQKFISQFFFCISGIYVKIGIVWKKVEPLRLFVSAIMDCKKRGYLNA